MSKWKIVYCTHENHIRVHTKLSYTVHTIRYTSVSYHLQCMSVNTPRPTAILQGDANISLKSDTISRSRKQNQEWFRKWSETTGNTLGFSASILAALSNRSLSLSNAQSVSLSLFLSGCQPTAVLRPTRHVASLLAFALPLRHWYRLRLLPLTFSVPGSFLLCTDFFNGGCTCTCVEHRVLHEC